MLGIRIFLSLFKSYLFMELPWNDPRSNKFATTIGLITSDGPYGPNIMACEWTHHLSYFITLLGRF